MSTSLNANPNVPYASRTRQEGPPRRPMRMLLVRLADQRLRLMVVVVDLLRRPRLKLAHLALQFFDSLHCLLQVHRVGSYSR
jgi:hypothetical protein